MPAGEGTGLEQTGDVLEDPAGKRFVLGGEIDERDRLGPDACGL
jgi:hypothetical protein